jgi:hypothetical protein
LTKQQVQDAADVLTDIELEVEARGYDLEYHSSKGFRIVSIPGYFTLPGVWGWLRGESAPTGA